MKDKNKKEFMRINSFFTNWSISSDAYENANITLLVRQAQRDIESVLRAVGYTDKEIQEYWLEHDRNV